MSESILESKRNRVYCWICKKAREEFGVDRNGRNVCLYHWSKEAQETYSKRRFGDRARFAPIKTKADEYGIVGKLRVE